MSTPPEVARDDPSSGIKHWRSFGRAEWRHVGEGVVGFLLGSALPLLSFFVLLQLYGLRPAALAVLVWSAVVFVWHRRRTGGSDVFSAATFAFALLEAGVGLVSDNVYLYLATPSLKNLVYGLAFVGSAAAGRPLLAMYAQRLYPIPEAVRRSPTYRRVFLVASLVWFVGLALRGTVRLVLMATLPFAVYLVVDNTLVGWTFSATLVGFTVWYPLRELRRAGVLSNRSVPVDVAGAAEEAADVAATP